MFSLTLPRAPRALVTLALLSCLSLFSVAAQAANSRAAQRAVVAHREALVQVRVAGVLRQLGVLGAGVPLSRTRILPSLPASVASGGTAASVAVSKASSSTKPLSFTVKNSVNNTSHVKDFVKKIYPYLVKVYGVPSPAQRGKTVSVEYDQGFAEGYGLSLDGSNGGYINFLPPSVTGRTQAQSDLALAQLMLNAFHGRQIFAYNLGDANHDPRVVDAWESGFSYAAALRAYYQYRGKPKSFDPSSLGAYLLPVYDYFNKPELGSAFFFAPNLQAPLGLSYYRVYMAQAAWLKVAVEDNTFFHDFNAAYYQRLTSDASLAGNVDSLISLAADILPQGKVEGLAFADWYRRQHVLDTHVATGEKLFIGGYASTSTATDGRHPYIGFAQHFSTSIAAADVYQNGQLVVSKGDVVEVPLTGSVTVRALDENGTDITASKLRRYDAKGRDITSSSGTTVDFDTADASGEAELYVGFIPTGTPDLGRVVLNLSNTAGLQSTAIFPYNVAGSTSKPAGYYGVVAPAVTGQIVTVPNGKTAGTVTLVRGAFASTATYASGPNTKVEFRFTSSAGTRSEIRNAAWSWNSSRSKPQSLAVLLDGEGSQTQLNVQSQPSGTNALRMISVPLRPLASDESEIFGIAPDKLILARYRPEMASGTSAGLQSSKYERYPHLSQPVGPGRGYWIHLSTALSTTVKGTEPDRARRYEVPLHGGWNQIGVPFNVTFDLDAVRVRRADGTESSYAAAVAARVLLPGVWGWKATGGYQRRDISSAARRKLVPFEGYFIYAVPDEGVTLLLNANQPTATATALPAADWSLSFSASSGSAVDDDNALGASMLDSNGYPLRLAAPKPPLPESALRLAFDVPGNPSLKALVTDQAGGWSEQYNPPLQAGKSSTWNFQVSGVSSGTSAQVAWGDPATLPVNWNFTLTDLKTNATRDLRSTPRSYTWASDGAARQFRVTAQPKPTTKNDPTASVGVKSWSVAALGGSGQATLTLEMVPGSVTGTHARVEILGDGEVIRVLSEAQALQATTTNWSWDGRNAAGLRLPGGDYTARITLERADGARDVREAAFVLR